ncbi:MAG TPA: DUF364 domain-containing protein, partial [Dehalococcoidales bacterium]|nr:DUF364 domain-containing protein [Dehalococcoidales bacterium]
MKVLDDLISSLSADSGVRDSVVVEVYTTAFWTAVMTRNWGLASTFREEHPHHARVRESGNLRGKPALELAEYVKSDNPMEVSIGIATINSLIDIDETKYAFENAFNILAQKGRGKNIAVVGHFPWTPMLKDIAKNLWVIDHRPRGDDLPAEAAEDILPQADVVGLTATSLINHTFERLMELCQGSFIVMIGPSTPLSPILFDYGLDVISGIKVVEPQEMLHCITEGAIFRQVKGVKLL